MENNHTTIVNWIEVDVHLGCYLNSYNGKSHMSIWFIVKDISSIKTLL
jgi:hypothetical protein